MSRALCCALSIFAITGARAEAPVSSQEARTEQLEAVAREVDAAERDFARTMADRDLEAFGRFVSETAVFRGGHGLLVGRKAVVDGWQSLFKPGPAPFSWEPDRVTAAASGSTAVSSGPVRDSSGKMIGRFTTVWHKEVEPAGGARWRVIVDQGVPLAECSAPSR